MTVVFNIVPNHMGGHGILEYKGHNVFIVVDITRLVWGLGFSSVRSYIRAHSSCSNVFS